MSFTLELARPSAAVLALALAIDLLVGELPTRAHPVVWMGALIRWTVQVLPSRGIYRQLLGGALLALLVPIGCAGLAALALGLLRPWPGAGFAVEVLSLTAMFAARALGEAARGVRQALDAAELGAARQALCSLCSRDPSLLTSEELVGASIESVAENASDSFVAPLFYYVLFGLPGAVFYRAVNTLDAMVGYHGRYEYLGKASARLDDVLNFIPARVTAALLVLGGALARKDVRRGLAVWRRDATTTESPNAGHPMATMAGLLGVRLEKAGHYQLGDPLAELAPHQIGVAWRIVQLAGGVWFLLVWSVLAAATHFG